MADHKIDGNNGAGNVQAPERIWLTTTESGKVDDWTQWLDDQDQLHPKAPRTEYIRADRFSYQLDAANARTEHWKAKYDAAVADRDAATARADQAYEDAASFIEETAYVPEKHHRYDCADKIRSLRDKPAPVVTVRDSFAGLIADARTEAEKAMKKFPQPNYVLLKVAEEAGEVVKAGVHFAEGRETRENVRSEMIQAIAMLYRLWVEGDQVNGVPPIAGGD